MAERRSHFRIDENLHLEYRVVDQDTANRGDPSQLFPGAEALKLYADLKAIEAEGAQLLLQIKNQNRQLADYLHGLNRKIDLLGQHVMAEHRPPSISGDTRAVNLSEGGIAFNSIKPIYKDSFIALRLTFLPSYAGVTLFARVIRCEAGRNDNHHIAAKFHRLNSAQRQLISKQIMRAQLAAKRRQGTSSDTTGNAGKPDTTP